MTIYIIRNREIKKYYRTHSLRDTGRYFNLSHERVRQILHNVGIMENENHMYGPGSRSKIKI